MSGNNWGAIAAVIGTLVVVLTFIRQIYRAAKADAAKDARDRAELQGKAFSDGAASRNDEVSLLKSERDDARRQRDEARIEIRDARLEARQWEQRYYGIVNRGGDHG